MIIFIPRVLTPRYRLEYEECIHPNSRAHHANVALFKYPDIRYIYERSFQNLKKKRMNSKKNQLRSPTFPTVREQK